MKSFQVEFCGLYRFTSKGFLDEQIHGGLKSIWSRDLNDEKFLEGCHSGSHLRWELALCLLGICK